jgi:spore coat protein A
MTGSPPLSRREFLKRSGLLAAALAMPGSPPSGTPPPVNPQHFFNPNSLARFVDPLPIPPLARRACLRPSPTDGNAKLPYYRIEMRQFESKLHRDLNPARQWGYDSSVPGPTFDTRKGAAFLVEWVNALPGEHFLPIDHNLHGATKDQPDVRTVVHVHGAKAPPASDGYPEAWYVSGKSQVSHYPNDQEAAMLWYHDHAMGINRLNIYAGLLGAFLIRDDLEDELGLPNGPYEIPLIIYDRLLDKDGQLYYPVSANPQAPWVPELYGNTILINGKVYPYLVVEPRRYRIRLLNAANTRSFVFSLSSKAPFYQIGTDLGLLQAPVPLKNLLLYPAERADLIIDFTGYEGMDITLKNSSVDLMQFRVARTGGKDSRPLPVKLGHVPRMVESWAVKTRVLTLLDYYDYAGNSMTMLLNGTRWKMPITEKPIINTVEIWSLVNLTDDVHPIHLHLVRFQILDRRPFDEFAYNTNKTLKYTGPALPPDPNEAGWKDTVRADPGMVTRIIARFEGYIGRYVWHCHLLEHEDNEMMRPYEVVASAEQASVPSALDLAAEWCVEGRIAAKPN